MSPLSAIFFGFLQGITEFLPISSFGHLTAIENSMGLSHDAGVLFEAMLHFGTLAGLIAIYRKDLLKIFLAGLGMLLDLIGNLHLFLHNRRTGDNLHYAKIVHGSYRKVTALLFFTSIPTAILGFVGRRLVELSQTSRLMPGIGLLLTGVFLIVVDYSKAGGRKTYRDASYDSALWVGICQGLSVFPGLSRCGLTLGCGLFCGFQRKFAVKYSFLAAVPAIIGATLVKLPSFHTAGITGSQGAVFFLGMVVAGITGYAVVRYMIRITQMIQLKFFAFYCFLAGALALAFNIA